MDMNRSNMNRSDRLSSKLSSRPSVAAGLDTMNTNFMHTAMDTMDAAKALLDLEQVSQVQVVPSVSQVQGPVLPFLHQQFDQQVVGKADDSEVAASTSSLEATFSSSGNNNNKKSAFKKSSKMPLKKRVCQVGREEGGGSKGGPLFEPASSSDASSSASSSSPSGGEVDGYSSSNSTGNSSTDSVGRDSYNGYDASDDSGDSVDSDNNSHTGSPDTSLLHHQAKKPQANKKKNQGVYISSIFKNESNKKRARKSSSPSSKPKSKQAKQVVKRKVRFVVFRQQDDVNNAISSLDAPPSKKQKRQTIIEQRVNPDIVDGGIVDSTDTMDLGNDLDDNAPNVSVLHASGKASSSRTGKRAREEERADQNGEQDDICSQKQQDVSKCKIGIHDESNDCNAYVREADRLIRPSPWFCYVDHSKSSSAYHSTTPLVHPNTMPSFPLKLHCVLHQSSMQSGHEIQQELQQQAQQPQVRDIIKWLPHGRSWRIVDTFAFEEQILPKYFGKMKMSSFWRQVNVWGFKRMTKGRNKYSYYHERFLRGLPCLCNEMEPQRASSSTLSHKKASSATMCTTSSNRATTASRASRSLLEPDLYQISQQVPLPPEDNSPGSDLAFLIKVNEIFSRDGPKAKMPLDLFQLSPTSSSSSSSSAAAAAAPSSSSAAKALPRLTHSTSGASLPMLPTLPIENQPLGPSHDGEVVPIITKKPRLVSQSDMSTLTQSSMSSRPESLVGCTSTASSSSSGHCSLPNNRQNSYFPTTAAAADAAATTAAARQQNQFLESAAKDYRTMGSPASLVLQNRSKQAYLTRGQAGISSTAHNNNASFVGPSSSLLLYTEQQQKKLQQQVSNNSCNDINNFHTKIPPTLAFATGPIATHPPCNTTVAQTISMQSTARQQHQTKNNIACILQETQQRAQNIVDTLANSFIEKNCAPVVFDFHQQQKLHNQPVQQQHVTQVASPALSHAAIKHMIMLAVKEGAKWGVQNYFESKIGGNNDKKQA